VNPKVTVLLPVYNGGNLVRTAIDSVLTQTFEDFELLVIDDCSTDDSAAIVGSYDDARIRLIRNEQNLGQVATLNRGIHEARGTYVARLDQDDVCLPRRLERQVALLDGEPELAVVGTWMDLLDDEGHLIWELRETIDDKAEFAFLILTNQLPLAHPTVMFRVEPVRALDGYDASHRLAEDQDLWRRLALAGFGARVVREPLVRYLVHSGQQSQRMANEQQVNNRRALESFIAALSGEAHARPLRLLLTWDYAFWRECGTRAATTEVARALEHLLTEARQRLRLDAAEAAKLERLLRPRVGLAARRSWRVGPLVHWRAAPPLLQFGLQGAARHRRAAAAFVYTTAPVLMVVRLGERAIETMWSWTWLSPVKRRAQRLRTARALYRVATRGRTTR
jgi:glycosyltransferase involved in cell wall biosynthesis